MPGEEVLEGEKCNQVPDISHSRLHTFIQSRYAIKTEKLVKLVGYDDLNYHLQGVSHMTNTNHQPQDLVLKITNEQESRVPGLVDSQVELQKHLWTKGIPVPALIPRLDGQEWALEPWELSDDKVVGLPVRIIAFLAGNHVKADTVSVSFCKRLGDMIASIHNATQDFKSPVLESYKTHWSLSRAPESLQYAYALKNESKEALARQCLDRFRTEFLPREKEFPQGVIHADLTETNVLVEAGEGGESVISGILDLGDSHKACYLYDIAIAILYLMLLHPPALPLDDIGAHVIQGYLGQRKLSESEIKAIPPSISARLSQSLILGNYTFSLNPVPENVYVLGTQSKGWALLEKLSALPENHLFTHWHQIITKS